MGARQTAECHSESRAAVVPVFMSQLYEEVYTYLYPALQPYLDRLTAITQGGEGA